MNYHNAIYALSILSGLAFIGYGLTCLCTNHMVKEFERYGLLKFRKLVGLLELLGGLGIIVGLEYSSIKFISSLGLTLLMFLGVLVRLKIKDSIFLILPAFILMIINLSIFLHELYRY